MKIVLAIILSVIVIKTTNACDCYTDSLHIAIDRSEEIFLGEVVKIIDDPESCWKKDDCLSVFVTIQIDQNFKGEKKGIVIHTMKSTASCGYPFNLGEKYLVYADKTETGYSTRLCSRTIESNNERALSDLKELKK
jgi:hypothetical protein|tara:strand:- start:617 stop:1024 length:408 start_codon:yes stop_codon:yes gene_type:complete